MIKLSIIICTYNRNGEVLRECLDSVAKQCKGNPLCEVIIVDNSSTDGTDETIKEYCDKYSNFCGVLEKEIGLSCARNKGAAVAKGSWLGYLDDDVLVPDGFIDRNLYIIDNYDFDSYGGRVLAWHKYDKPRWLKDSLVDTPLENSKIGIIDVNNLLSGATGYIIGCSWFVKKEIIFELGGFSSELGMKGKEIGYGEETYFQMKMREKGYKIGFDPDLYLYHLVGEHKLKLLWYVKASIAQGHACRIMFNRDLNSHKDFRRTIKHSVFGLFSNFFRNIVKLVKKDYYWENFLLDVFRPFCFNIGMLKGILYLRKNEVN